MTRTSHSIDVAAPADRIYRIIADVTAWPVHFPPTVHAERVCGDDWNERIRIWAVANNELRSWESDRRLDRSAHTIEFMQTRPRYPVATMIGSWRVIDRGRGGSHVVLTHVYTAVGDDSDGLALIDKAVDTNSTSELKAIKAIAERGAEPLVFSDSVVIDGSAQDGYEFVYACDRWPQRLPHVRRVHLAEAEPGLQLMEMDTESSDGSVHTTASWRVCMPGSRIVYKQTKSPDVMSVHTGEWTFQKLPGGAVCATSRHTVVINQEALAALKASGMAPADPAKAIREALGANSLATLGAAKAFAERRETVTASGGQGKLMKELMLDELKDALRAAAGEDEPGALEQDILDREFTDLGYDSLAVMEMTSLLQRRLGVKLSEEQAAEIHTPREFLAFVNAKLMAA